MDPDRRGRDEAQLDRLVIASDAVQRALRLVNDLSTYERDLRWGDLNAIMLVDDRSVVEQELKRLVAEATDLLEEFRVDCPTEAGVPDPTVGLHHRLLPEHRLLGCVVDAERH